MPYVVEKYKFTCMTNERQYGHGQFGECILWIDGAHWNALFVWTQYNITYGILAALNDKLDPAGMESKLYNDGDAWGKYGSCRKNSGLVKVCSR